jgi:hypothetical protein
MRHELGEGEEAKKDDKKVAGRRNSDAENHDPAIDPDLFEIEPADFFDPEEFGIGRRSSSNGR